ncbi:hypothetical protein EMIHUDRAFT_427966 [Emiliania huxleyi CCMP1516]|uniref:Peptidase S9 prolyl oligopeptidase catalytic domain-containing protein n=2 Tax=Emiliania huxleyi TaxID=2903 RepID=A0A0D3IKM3_EMIH1|nr:hypothetical protein EMIHUDRAFT_427966 [Emiliania huxleyi CCMP1516]EOD11808.1 hypothetical protein EMIHUDRAFT_427966 [Emiliania huxleyi CCMP1516]|eukprot:XP_005764237.1 hypothetical protein EMIHUDRAFT_427966 [Emiliania huxleyi CCMP1516]
MLTLAAVMAPSLRLGTARAASNQGAARMSSSAAAPTSAPYGAWPSAVTAKFITTSGVRIGGLGCDDSGSVYWLEGRPQEGGRQVVVKYAPGAEGASERGAVDATPKDANVRTRVHEYGGGAHLLTPKGVVYSDFKSQRLFLAPAGGGDAVCLTPESAWPDGQYRFADARLTPDGRHLVCVREDHSPTADAKPSAVLNEVVSVALDGSGAMTVLATGADFYAAPRLSPDGRTLAYITWEHPSMPWDATTLRVRPLGPLATAEGAGEDETAASTAGHARVAGADAEGCMSDGDISVQQPAFSPSGALYFISDESGFWNLYRAPPDGGYASAVNVLPRPTDFGGGSPGWQFGQQGFAFLQDGRVVATYVDRGSGQSRLVLLDDVAAPTPSEFGSEEGLPFFFGSLVESSDDGALYMLGGSPQRASGVYRWSGLLPGGGGAAEMIACSSSSEIDESLVSVPRPVEFPAPMGTSYGYYYPPRNDAFTSDEAAPPLLVKAHGGPTAATSTAFNPAIQFWTSRGFAVLDVDYGGSMGYGRDYRRRLRGNWGVCDIDDVCAGAQHLVAEGLADPKRLAIDGGSAGGYTTLGALAFKDIFTAGCSLYGVADLGCLAGDTHKFESRYLDGLVGKYPEDKQLYDERAPINAVDSLSCPVLLLQGDEDKIAELMHAALLKKGLPCALKMYQGEQHGFRKAENIEDALNSELFFFSRVFGIEPTPDAAPFDIDNMPA